MTPFRVTMRIKANNPHKVLATKKHLNGCEIPSRPLSDI